MPSIFSDEWRDCLRAHYTYVVRTGDHGTEKTLRGVMYDAGFGEDDLKELYVLATAHVDDVGADFTPDMDIFAQEAAPVSVAVAMPQEVIEAIVVEESVASHELDDVNAQAEPDEPPPKDDPDVTQLSLF